MNRNPPHKPLCSLKKMIPLWRSTIVILNWHCFSVTANVTFIPSFLFYSCVSSDLQRRRVRKRERCGVIWLSFTSGALSLRQAVVCLPSLTCFFFSLHSSTWALCCAASRVLQREKDAGLLSLCAFCLCQHFLRKLAHYERLLQSLVRFSTHVVNLYTRVCLCVFSCAHKHNRSWCIQFHTNPDILISPGHLWSSSASLISEESNTIPLFL